MQKNPSLSKLQTLESVTCYEHGENLGCVTVNGDQR